MRKLLDLYYTIWVDCIIKIKSIPANKTDWKYKCMVFMSMAMALQFGIFIVLFERHITHTNFYKLDIDVFLGKNIDAFISFFILFLLPFLLLNYFLIFWKDRYKMLIEKYEYKEGNYATIYMMGTFFGFSLLMLIGLIVKILTE